MRCWRKNFDTFSVQIHVLKERKIWINLRQSRRTTIVEGFQLSASHISDQIFPGRCVWLISVISSCDRRSVIKLRKSTILWILDLTPHCFQDKHLARRSNLNMRPLKKQLPFSTAMFTHLFKFQHLVLFVLSTIKYHWYHACDLYG